MHFKCPDCKKYLLPKGEFTVKCPQCGGVFEWVAIENRKGEVYRLQLKRYVNGMWLTVPEE